MSNFLDLESFGTEIKSIVGHVKRVVKPLRETVDMLNQQELSSFMRQKLAKKSDRIVAKMCVELKARVEARSELLDYLVRVIENAVAQS
jgi:hypothetical protein